MRVIFVHDGKVVSFINWIRYAKFAAIDLETL